ncbi:UNVERIFIED_CONTAM: hypothetical protein GTU68_047978, partial [Idotea baltica]|nr:hypothetical protein [Idotea baltica]
TFSTSGTRGNEWLSVATTLNFAQKFRFNGWLTGGLNISIVPLVNPDGYIYSQLTDRTWAKNRATSSSSSCVGVNLGRNWDIDWGVSNSSTNPCNSNYAGTAAFSELETSAIKNAIEGVDNFKLAVDFQGSGRRILYPYYFVKTSVNPPDNLTTIIRSANEIADEAFLINGTFSYLVENGAAINQASGTASDFAIDMGIDYAYTIETTTDDDMWAGRYSDNIQPTKHELWAGLKPLILKIRNMD